MNALGGYFAGLWTGTIILLMVLSGISAWNHEALPVVATIPFVVGLMTITCILWSDDNFDDN